MMNAEELTDMKRCSDCKTDKPLADFYGNKARPSGRADECKVCSKVRTTKWRKDNIEVHRGYVRRGARHGQDIVAQSEHRCAICRAPFSEIDHDHATGLRRCDPCNIGLGAFRDNPEALRQAASYLEG